MKTVKDNFLQEKRDNYSKQQKFKMNLNFEANIALL